MKVRQTFEGLRRLPERVFPERVYRAVAIREPKTAPEAAPEAEPAAEPATSPASPVRDGRIICPSCSPDAPDACFEATADALVTVYLSPVGTLRSWKDIYIAEEGYRELQCGSCGRWLGDLTFEDLQELGTDPETEEE